MKIGQEVYTVNAKTNQVDTWTFNGSIRTKEGLIICLRNGKKCGFLPARCVYASKNKALAVAESK